MILFLAVHSANPEEELASEFLASVQSEGVFGHDSEESSQPSSQEDWIYTPTSLSSFFTLSNATASNENLTDENTKENFF